MFAFAAIHTLQTGVKLAPSLTPLEQHLLKTESCHDANFIAVGIGSCHNIIRYFQIKLESSWLLGTLFSMFISAILITFINTLCVNKRVKC